MTTSAKDIARRLIEGPDPLRETAGKNRSPMIDTIVRSVGGRLGDPYCAAGISYCFKQAEIQMAREPGRIFVPTMSSQAIRRMGEKAKQKFVDPNLLLQCKGALGGWTNPGDPNHGHVFMVIGRLTSSKGMVVGITTYEFNSDLFGDRDGQGGYKLVRRIGLDGLWYVENARRKLVGTGRQIWFVDTSDFRAGRWWL